MTDNINEAILQFVGRADTTDIAVARYLGLEDRVYEVAEHIDHLIANGVLAEVGTTRLADTGQVARVVGKARVVGGSRADRCMELYQQWAHCTRCGLSQVRKRVTFAHGSLNAQVMVVAMSPTEPEDECGTPMVGDPAYFVLKKAMDTAGFDFGTADGVIAVNMVACASKDTATGGLREPRPSEIAVCRQHVQELLNIVQPRVVVLLGTDVVASFFDRVPASFPFERKGVTFIKSYSVADIVMKPDRSKDSCVEWNLVRQFADRAAAKVFQPVAWTLPYPT